MIKGICYYHADSDGIMSAAIVEKFMQEPERDMIYIPVQYGYDETEFLKQTMQETYDYIFVVDFSFTENIMENLRRQANKEFVWIDHHKSAMEKLPDLWNSDQIGGLREIGKSGCLLTWEWFCPHEDLPLSVIYVNDYDLWLHALQPTKPFHEAFCLKCVTPPDVLKHNLIEDEVLANHTVLKFIELGVDLMSAKMQRIEKVFKTGIKTGWAQYNCYVVESQHDVSDLGNYILENVENIDFAVIKKRTAEQVIYSLRSKGDFDVSKIAKQYGGGGHKNAAGFHIKHRLSFNV